MLWNGTDQVCAVHRRVKGVLPWGEYPIVQSRAPCVQIAALRCTLPCQPNVCLLDVPRFISCPLLSNFQEACLKHVVNMWCHFLYCEEMRITATEKMWKIYSPTDFFVNSVIFKIDYNTYCIPFTCCPISFFVFIYSFVLDCVSGFT